MSPLPRVSAIVVHYQAEQYLARCLDALARAGESMPLEIIVVDNASLNDVNAWRERYPQVKWLVQVSNRGFAAGVNVGLAHATSAYVLIQNPDAWLLDAGLERLVKRLDHVPHLGAVTPQLVDGLGRPQAAGGDAPTLARILLGKATAARRFDDTTERRSSLARELQWASAAVLLCRRAALDAVGGMDEGFFLYYEDCDLGVRLRRHGWHIELLPTAQAVHVGGVSFAADSGAQLRAYLRGQRLYFQKHRPPLEGLVLSILQYLYGTTGLRRLLRGMHR